MVIRPGLWVMLVVIKVIRVFAHGAGFIFHNFFSKKRKFEMQLFISPMNILADA